MSTPENKRKELEHILNRDNFVKISSAIKALRDESPFGGAIGLLVSFYDRTDNHSIKRLIEEFLNDLKDQNSCREVVDELGKSLKPETLRMLVASCWQSGLDYSGFVSDFAELFVSGDFATAIECFTVIESSSGHLTKAEKAALVGQLKKNASGVSGEKTALAMELLYFLEQTDED